MPIQAWTITVRDHLPTAANRRERQHWSIRQKEKTLWRDLIGYQGGNRIPRATPHTRRRVTITLHKGPRGKHDDPGNLPYRAKAILDALVDLQILWDDDRDHLTLDPITEHLPTPDTATRITITEDPA